MLSENEGGERPGDSQKRRSAVEKKAAAAVAAWAANKRKSSQRQRESAKGPSIYTLSGLTYAGRRKNPSKVGASPRVRWSATLPSSLSPRVHAADAPLPRARRAPDSPTRPTASGCKRHAHESVCVCKYGGIAALQRCTMRGEIRSVCKERKREDWCIFGLYYGEGVLLPQDLSERALIWWVQARGERYPELHWFWRGFIGRMNVSWVYGCSRAWVDVNVAWLVIRVI